MSPSSPFLCLTVDITISSLVSPVVLHPPVLCISVRCVTISLTRPPPPCQQPSSSDPSADPTTGREDSGEDSEEEDEDQQLVSSLMTSQHTIDQKMEEAQLQLFTGQQPISSQDAAM